MHLPHLFAQQYTCISNRKSPAYAQDTRPQSPGDLMSRAVSLSLYTMRLLCCFILVLSARALSSSPPRIACDFELPPFHMSAILPNHNHFPPFPVVPASSRYTWTCVGTDDPRFPPQFSVDLHARLPISGMLTLATQSNRSRGTQVILAEFPDDEPSLEWEVEAEALFSDMLDDSAALPKLGLHFISAMCGCVKRVRFNWIEDDGAALGSCEVAVSVHSGGAGADSSCFPSWAFHSADVPSASDIRGPHRPNACSPVRWASVPLPQPQLRSASFNGHCRCCIPIRI
jgi:hypothetical protein